jgi:hypothetical protein
MKKSQLNSCSIGVNKMSKILMFDTLSAHEKSFFHFAKLLEPQMSENQVFDLGYWQLSKLRPLASH